jgi:hypothetical protein
MLKGANKRPGMLFRRWTGNTATAYRDIALTVCLIGSALISQVSAHRVAYSQREKAVQIPLLLCFAGFESVCRFLAHFLLLQLWGLQAPVMNYHLQTYFNTGCFICQTVLLLLCNGANHSKASKLSIIIWRQTLITSPRIDKAEP